MNIDKTYKLLLQRNTKKILRIMKLAIIFYERVDINWIYLYQYDLICLDHYCCYCFESVIWEYIKLDGRMNLVIRTAGFSTLFEKHPQERVYIFFRSLNWKVQLTETNIFFFFYWEFVLPSPILSSSFFFLYFHF